MNIQLEFTTSNQHLPRPSKSSYDVLYRTATNLAPKINEWSGDEFQIDINTLKDAIQYNSLNGYVMAQNLENSCGIQPDVELVEILDDVWFIKKEVHDDIVKEWVKDYNISPGKKVGDLVTIKCSWKEITETGLTKVSGEIVSIDTELATYLVCCESLGHVKEGVGTHGVIVNYEDID
jgi:hypothetical protein